MASLNPVPGSFVAQGAGFPGYGASKIYFPTVRAMSTDGGGTGTTNRIFAAPLEIQAASVDFAGFKVEQANSAPTGNLRAGIFSNTGGAPNALNTDIGAVAFPGSTGIRTCASAFTLTRGTYWIVAVMDAALVYRRINQSAIDYEYWLHNYGLHLAALSSTVTAGPGMPYGSHTYGALPSTFPSVAGIENQCPLIGLYTA